MNGPVAFDSACATYGTRARLARMQQVPALDLERLAAQLARSSVAE